MERKRLPNTDAVRKRGVQKYLTEDQIIQVEALAATLNIPQIAEYFGISVGCFNKMRQDNPEIERRYRMGKSRAIDTVASALIQKAESGNVTAMMFYLRTQAGWKDVRRVEQTGADGSPIQVESKKLNINLDFSGFSDEELNVLRKLGLKSNDEQES